MITMSKYKELWEYIKNSKEGNLTLTFSDIENILGFPIDHSFLKYKKELLDYGYIVEKISMKDKKIIFRKNEV